MSSSGGATAPPTWRPGKGPPPAKCSRPAPPISQQQHPVSGSSQNSSTVDAEGRPRQPAAAPPTVLHHGGSPAPAPKKKAPPTSSLIQKSHQAAPPGGSPGRKQTPPTNMEGMQSQPRRAVAPPSHHGGASAPKKTPPKGPAARPTSRGQDEHAAVGAAPPSPPRSAAPSSSSAAPPSHTSKKKLAPPPPSHMCRTEDDSQEAQVVPPPSAAAPASPTKAPPQADTPPSSPVTTTTAAAEPGPGVAPSPNVVEKARNEEQLRELFRSESARAAEIRKEKQQQDQQRASSSSPHESTRHQQQQQKQQEEQDEEEELSTTTTEATATKEENVTTQSTAAAPRIQEAETEPLPAQSSEPVKQRQEEQQNTMAVVVAPPPDEDKEPSSASPPASPEAKSSALASDTTKPLQPVEEEEEDDDDMFMDQDESVPPAWQQPPPPGPPPPRPINVSVPAPEAAQEPSAPAPAQPLTGEQEHSAQAEAEAEGSKGLPRLLSIHATSLSSPSSEPHSPLQAQQPQMQPQPVGSQQPASVSSQPLSAENSSSFAGSFPSHLSVSQQWALSRSFDQQQQQSSLSPLSSPRSDAGRRGSIASSAGVLSQSTASTTARPAAPPPPPKLVRRKSESQSPIGSPRVGPTDTAGSPKLLEATVIGSDTAAPAPASPKAAASPKQGQPSDWDTGKGERVQGQQQPRRQSIGSPTLLTPAKPNPKLSALKARERKDESVRVEEQRQEEEAVEGQRQRDEMMFSRDAQRDSRDDKRMKTGGGGGGGGPSAAKGLPGEMNFEFDGVEDILEKEDRAWRRNQELKSVQPKNKVSKSSIDRLAQPKKKSTAALEVIRRREEMMKRGEGGGDDYDYEDVADGAAPQGWTTIHQAKGMEEEQSRKALSSEAKPSPSLEEGQTSLPPPQETPYYLRGSRSASPKGQRRGRSGAEQEEHHHHRSPTGSPKQDRLVGQSQDYCFLRLLALGEEHFLCVHRHLQPLWSAVVEAGLPDGGCLHYKGFPVHTHATAETLGLKPQGSTAVRGGGTSPTPSPSPASSGLPDVGGTPQQHPIHHQQLYTFKYCHPIEAEETTERKIVEEEQLCQWTNGIAYFISCLLERQQLPLHAFAEAGGTFSTVDSARARAGAGSRSPLRHERMMISHNATQKPFGSGNRHYEYVGSPSPSPNRLLLSHQHSPESRNQVVKTPATSKQNEAAAVAAYFISKRSESEEHQPATGGAEVDVVGYRNVSGLTPKDARLTQADERWCDLYQYGYTLLPPEYERKAQTDRLPLLKTEMRTSSLVGRGSRAATSNDGGVDAGGSSLEVVDAAGGGSRSAAGGVRWGDNTVVEGSGYDMSSSNRSIQPPRPSSFSSDNQSRGGGGKADPLLPDTAVVPSAQTAPQERRLAPPAGAAAEQSPRGGGNGTGGIAAALNETPPLGRRSTIASLGGWVSSEVNVPAPPPQQLEQPQSAWPDESDRAPVVQQTAGREETSGGYHQRPPAGGAQQGTATTIGTAAAASTGSSRRVVPNSVSGFVLNAANPPPDTSDTVGTPSWEEYNWSDAIEVYDEPSRWC